MQLHAIIQKDSIGYFVWFREDPADSSPFAEEVVEVHKVPDEMSFKQVDEHIKKLNKKK